MPTNGQAIGLVAASSTVCASSQVLFLLKSIDITPPGIFRCSEGEVVVEQAPGVFLRHNLDLNSEWDLPDCGGVEGMCAEPGCALRENQVAARVRSRKRKMAGHLPLVQEEEKEGDHEARTESLILQRGSMRHLADWFYPDGGWGWRVVLAAALIQILVLGPVLGGGQVLFLLM